MGKELTTITDQLMADLRYKGEPSDEQFAIISKNLPFGSKKEELFVYSVKVCDNFLDREGDIFSTNALFETANLLTNTTGIYDHEWSSKNQHSRIFDSILIEDPSQVNPLGEPYRYVVGFAYTLNSPANADLVDNIKAGILSEVSLGFNSKDDEEVTLNDGNLANIIGSVVDVVEWSFVAIPAQPKAGVIKSYNPKEVKSMKLTQALTTLKSFKDIDASAITSIETFLKGYEDGSASYADLQIKVKSLEADVESKDAEIIDLKQKSADQAIEHALGAVLGNFDFVSDIAMDMAKGIALKSLEVTEDGSVGGTDQVIEMLTKDYSFLAKAKGETKVEEAEETLEDDEDAELDDKLEEEEEKSKSKSYKHSKAKGSIPQGLQFTVKSTVAPVQNKSVKPVKQGLQLN